jgi:D-3-phosphoglycerate dehydrogenase
VADNLGDAKAVEEMIARLRPLAEVIYRPEMSRGDLLSEIQRCEVLIVRSRTTVDKELIDRAGALKLVITATHGIDHIDVEHLHDRGIAFRNMSEQTNAVAEFVLALILCMGRKVSLADRLSKLGSWKKDDLVGLEILGKTIGVVGFGRIGQSVATKASALGMKALIHETVMTTEKEERARRIGARVVSLDELLRSSDVVTLHVPKTRGTYKMIGRKEFALMKDGVLIVNAARGDIVDEEALLEYLEKGKFVGVAIDVYSIQPPFDQQLLRRIITDDRVVATQHMGGQTREARRATIESISNMLEGFLGGG